MWLAILPSQVWDRLAALRGRLATGEGGGIRLRTPRAVELAAAALCLFLVASVSAATAGFFRGSAVSLGPVDTAAGLLRIRQNWPMFSPEPPPFDLWTVLRGQLANGRQVDPFRGGPVVTKQPESVAAYFPSFKWKIHFWWLGHKSWDEQQPHIMWAPLADHLCHDWNARHDGPERLRSIDIVLRIEAIQPHLSEDPVHSWPVLRGHRCP